MRGLPRSFSRAELKLGSGDKASRPGFRASALTLFTKAELKLGSGDKGFAAEGASRPGFRASALTLFTRAELKLGSGDKGFAAEGASRPGFRASALTLFTKAELKLGAWTKLRGQGLELTELDHSGDALYDGVFAVFVGVVGGLEVDTEEAAESLPEAGTEAAEEGFEDVVA